MFKPEKRHILFIVLAALGVRVAAFALMPPSVFPDSIQYMELADMIVRGDLSGYDGARTPGYPLLILAFGKNLQALTLFQMLLGLGSCVLLYLIFGMLFRDRAHAVAGALAFALSPFQAVFERDILSESLTTFLLLLAVYHLLRIWRGRSATPVWLLMGLAAALTAFVRPMMQPVPLLLAGAAVLTFHSRGGASFLPTAGRLAVALLPAVVILGGWSAFNYTRFDYPGLTTLAGFNLTNHSGAFMEKAPPEYKDIADIYISHRERLVPRIGTHATTIWYALPDLEAATGLSRPELSRRFGRLSVRLFRDNPGLYLRSVAKSFTIFWLPAWYTGGSGLLPALRSGNASERLLLWPLSLAQALFTGLFFMLPVALALSLRMQKALPFNFGLAALYLIVFVTAILTSLMEYGENARYEQSVEPFVIGTGLCVIISLIQGKLRREKPVTVDTP